MTVQVEFEHGGRTYRVEPGVYKWDVYALNALREKVSLNTDINTGEQIFVAWSEIAVLRLVKSE
jgi:hypothetical protein